jgi:hypothetical protein
MKAGETVGWDVPLEPTAPVIVTTGEPLTAAPSGSHTVEATVTIRDGSTLKGIHWTMQREGERVTAILTDENSPKTRVTLPDLAEYKSSLLNRLRKHGRLLDRWMVIGLVPSDLREAGRVSLKATATTSSGAYSDNLDIFADLSHFADVNPGLQNVVVGKAVLLQGKGQPSYNWSLVAPPGSGAVLHDAKTQNPYFIPDVAGAYTVREGDRTRLTIYGGSWRGVVIPEKVGPGDSWRRSATCLCHEMDPIAPKFTAWRTSGHAEMFQQCVNTVFHYEKSCFTCHAVGSGGRTSDGGLTSVHDYRAFLKDSTLWNQDKNPPVVNPRPGNYDMILTSYPDVAKLANIQCENCHGPNNSPAHMTLKKTGAPERMTLSPEVCGNCHDDPADDSYALWHTSRHSNYGSAIEAGTIEKRGEAASDCGRCHTGQGFLAWLARGDRLTPLVRPGTPATQYGLKMLGLTVDKVQPVTCPICHEPHASGSSFRSKTEKVPVRAVDTTRMFPREFKGETVGRDALCIVCHSTVNGAQNDGAIPRMSSDALPHAPQADVLFGRNAFFTGAGTHKDHSRIDKPNRVEDACIWCHVKSVPKPSDRGYPRKGVSHTFKSTLDKCPECHEGANGGELMRKFATKGDLEGLKITVEGAIREEIDGKEGIRLIGAGSRAADVSLRGVDIREVLLVELDGKMGIEVISMTDGVYRVPLGLVSLGDALFTETDSGQILLKSAWNYFLLKNDGSLGVHNPTFVKEVLNETGGKVRALHRQRAGQGFPADIESGVSPHL